MSTEKICYGGISTKFCLQELTYTAQNWVIISNIRLIFSNHSQQKADKDHIQKNETIGWF